MSVRGSVLVVLLALAATLAAPVTWAETPPTAGQPGVNPKPAARQSLALVAVTRGEGFSDRQSGTLQELLLTALQTTGRFKVIGQSDIDALLTIEARKQAVGCGDTECMVQLAGALGVDLVATADVGRLGNNTLLSLKVISMRTTSVIARAQATVQSDNDLPQAARTLADDIVLGMDGGDGVARAAQAPPPPTPRRRSLPARITGFVFLGLALAAGGVAVDYGLQAKAGQTALHNTPRSGADAQKLMQTTNLHAFTADVSIGGALVFGSVGIGLAAAF